MLCYVNWGRKQATTKFYFSLCTWAWFLGILTVGGFAYIWQSKWVGIVTMKARRTQIHLLSDVFSAVASSDLKVSAIFLRRLMRFLHKEGLVRSLLYYLTSIAI